MKMFCLTVGTSTIYVNADYYETCFNNLRFYQVTSKTPLLVAIFPDNLIESIYVDDVVPGLFTFKTDFERKDNEE